MEKKPQCIQNKNHYVFFNDSELNQLAVEFIQIKIDQDLSDSTINQYRSTFRMFKKIRLSDFDRRDFIKFAVDSIENKKIADNTLRSRLVQLCSFNTWLFYNSKCLRRHNSPKIDKRPRWRDMPSQDEWDHFFEQMKLRYESATEGRRWTRWRDYLVCRVLYETGMRISECSRLRYGDLIIYDAEHFWLFIAGGKSPDAERSCPISEKLCDEIRAFTWSFSRCNKTAMLFSKKPHTPFDTCEVGKLIKKLAFQFKMSVDVTPHVFRHNFILEFVANGGSALELMTRLGHSDVQMTVYYFNQVRRLLPFAKVNADISILERKNKSRARFWDEKKNTKGR